MKIHIILLRNGLVIHLNDFNLSNESFDIEPELIVSKIINERSKVIYTNKNTLDPYGYDLNCFNKINNNFGM